MTKAEVLKKNLDSRFPIYAPHNVIETPCSDIAFMKVARGCWRFVALDGDLTNIEVTGPNYSTRRDLLLDMGRFLSDNGYQTDK